MTRAVSCCVLALASWLACVAAVDAQVATAAPVDVDACARHIYREVAPLDRPRLGAERQSRIVLRIIASAEACGLPPEVRTAARRASRAHWEQEPALLAPFLESHPRTDCRPHTQPDGGSFMGTECRPRHPAVGGLVTSLGIERAMANHRRFLVSVLDALTDASPRLVAAAQLLWVYASWDHRCVPSVVFTRMRADLRSGHVRFEPYPD